MKSRIDWRALAVSLLCTLLVMMLAFAYLSERHTTMTASYIDERIAQHRLAIDAAHANHRSVVEVYFENLASRRGLIPLLDDAAAPDGRDLARLALYRRLYPLYTSFAARGVRSLQIYLPDGTLLLRFDQPERFGDRQLAAQPRFQQVQQRGEVFHGFNANPGDPGLSDLFPLYDTDKRLVALVGFSAPLTRMEQQLRALLPSHEFELLLRHKAPLDDKIDALYTAWPVQSDWLVEDIHKELPEAGAPLSARAQALRALLSDDTEFRERITGSSAFGIPLSIDDDRQLVTISPLSGDRIGEPSSLLVSYSAAPELDRLQIDRDTSVFVTAIALSLLMMLGYQALSAHREALAQRQRLFTVQESLGEALYVVDPNGRITDINARMVELLGYPSERLIGTIAHDLFHIDHDGRHTSLEACPIYVAGMALREYSGDAIFLTADQREMAVRVISRPMLINDELVGIVTSFTDVTGQRETEARLRESEARFRNVVSHVEEIIFQTDESGLWTYLNPAWTKITGYSVESCLGRSFLEFVHPDSHDEACDDFARMLRTSGGSGSHESRFVAADGSDRWLLIHGRSTLDEQGRITGIIGTFTDITARKASERQLRLAASVFTHAQEGIVITDVNGTIVEANDAFSQITGYSRDEVLGKNPRLLSSGRMSRNFYEDMWQRLTREGRWQGEIWNRRKSGDEYAELLTISAVESSSGEVRNYVALFSDISAQKAHQAQLEHIAHHDALTGLPNRMLLGDRLKQAMLVAKRRHTFIAVAYVDLDGFKAINDNHGHEAGDRLLVTVSRRMRAGLREGDTIARLGGDEFVAVMTDLDSMNAASPLVQRLLEAISQPVDDETGQASLQVSGSIGLTFYPQGEELDADQLLRQADKAMFEAKSAGKNRCHRFDLERERNERGLARDLNRIERGLFAHEFELFYQPKVNMRTGMLVGAEALIRWRHPERGLLAPGEFLPDIQGQSFEVTLGEWVIETALAQIDTWGKQGMVVPTSVNISGHHLQQQNFIERLKAVLGAHPHVKAHLLELEVLESSALSDISRVSSVISGCAEMGVSVALDDFGTGYSSLTYLKRLPANVLKIDRSFVHDLLDDPDDLAILIGILGMASAFRRDVVAEGMETSELGTLLIQLGCENAQGYGIARPMPADELLPWYRNWRPDPQWSQVRRIHERELPLIQSACEHRAWLRQLDGWLRGESSSPPPMNPHECRFGRWFDSLGDDQRLAFGPRFQRVEYVHESLHQVASRLMAARESGDEAAVTTARTALEHERLRLLDCLTPPSQYQFFAPPPGMH